MTELTFTVRGGAFFAPPGSGAAATASVSLRGDRTAGLLLIKCLRHCPVDGLLPDGLLGPLQPPGPSADASSATAEDDARAETMTVNLAWTVAEVAKAHGNNLALFAHAPAAAAASAAAAAAPPPPPDAAAALLTDAALDARPPVRTECWQCDGTSNHELVARLQAAGAFSSPKVGRALLAADRRAFCRFPDLAFADAPQTMGPGWSISAPHLHANALQVLAPVLCPGARCLDAGCGSGLVACAMAWLANGESFQGGSGESVKDDSGSGGTVFKPAAAKQQPWRCLGVDCEPAAVAFANRAAQSLCPALLRASHAPNPRPRPPEPPPSDSAAAAGLPLPDGAAPLAPKGAAPGTAAAAAAGTAVAVLAARGGGPRLQFAVADGWGGGGYAESEFDAIHVGAVADEVPAALLRALAPGGRMVIAVRGDLVCVDRGDGPGGHPRDARDAGTRATCGASPVARAGSTEESLGLPLGYTAAIVYEGAGFTPLHRK